MPVISVGTENSGPIGLHYEDYGSGTPVILIHGYPLSGRAWDKQVPPLLAAGHRVITYDRRGAGSSSQPATGYDWDTFAADLDKLIDTLGLEDVALVGDSMGTGEVTRYPSSYGSGKVDRAVLIGPIPPYLSQAPDNPDGVPANLFERPGDQRWTRRRVQRLVGGRTISVGPGAGWRPRPAAGPSPASAAGRSRYRRAWPGSRPGWTGHRNGHAA
jgi:pimeloyl-ACP methyl ester carboxylesterase